jgi:hypothetical protein
VNGLYRVEIICGIFFLGVLFSGRMTGSRCGKENEALRFFFLISHVSFHCLPIHCGVINRLLSVYNF